MKVHHFLMYYKIESTYPKDHIFHKMIKYFIFYGVAMSIRSPLSPGMLNRDQCYTSQLQLPEHGKGWNCTGSSNTTPNINDRCKAVCEDNYRLELCKSMIRNFKITRQLTVITTDFST